MTANNRAEGARVRASQRIFRLVHGRRDRLEALASKRRGEQALQHGVRGQRARTYMRYEPALSVSSGGEQALQHGCKASKHFYSFLGCGEQAPQPGCTAWCSCSGP